MRQLVIQPFCLLGIGRWELFLILQKTADIANLLSLIVEIYLIP